MDNLAGIKLREVVRVAKNKLKIVSKIRVNGEVYLQEELDPEEFRRMVEKKITEFMEGIGFERDKTA